MKTILAIFSLLLIANACTSPVGKTIGGDLAKQISADPYFPFVKGKALEVMKTGFNAGDGYREVWIRDYNTFIELAAQVNEKEELKENLLVFCRMQGDDGNIIDGFTPVEQVGAVEYDFTRSELEPRYAAHKNTVETDQESSLVQAVYKYVQLTGDRGILDEMVGDKTVGRRLEWSMDFLMNHRFNQEYGLLTGATTADWGDVQPEHGWGVDLDQNTHYAIDIYDNAMFIIALDNLMEMIPAIRDKWGTVKEGIAENSRRHLWDNENQKFIPHIYLNGSPFPDGFDENQIYYFGGTAIAIEAGLLSKEEVKLSLDEMVKRVKLAGAASIGLTLYPPYPAGYFANQIMNPEYSYQNGGDWTWFGGRMIQQLIRYGFYEEAYEQIRPMVKRVKDNNGFYEWYSVDNQPRGSGTFRGEAGVLFTAIRMFEEVIGSSGGTLPAGAEMIRAYNLDFNWGEGGPNAFAAPGLWADANPKEHVKWYKDLGVNTIQTFCVSCNGYAWYKNGVIPAQPGLKYDFLPEMVRLGHKKGMKVFGYYCIGTNTRWGLENPDYSYGIPADRHIPYTRKYLEYLDTAIREAVGKTGIDGFMIDWFYQPNRASTNGEWLACEKERYQELMGEPFPGADSISAEDYDAYSRLAIGKTWDVIHNAAKETNPDCKIWLTCFDITHPHIINSRMFQEIDWLMNEGGDLERIGQIRSMVGKNSRLITCLANWNKQDAKTVVIEAIASGVGLYGFAKPDANSLLPPADYYLSTPIDSLSGDHRNIATFARVFNDLPLDYILEKK